MSNILALAHKEVKSAFSTPIAYVVIGFFALLYGIFFVAIMRYFASQSMQAGLMGGAQAMNVNQQLIRPLLQNVTVVVTALAGPPPSWSSTATHTQSAKVCSMVNGVITCV